MTATLPVWGQLSSSACTCEPLSTRTRTCTSLGTLTRQLQGTPICKPVSVTAGSGLVGDRETERQRETGRGRGGQREAEGHKLEKRQRGTQRDTDKGRGQWSVVSQSKFHEFMQFGRTSAPQKETERVKEERSTDTNTLARTHAQVRTHAPCSQARAQERPPQHARRHAGIGMHGVAQCYSV